MNITVPYKFKPRDYQIPLFESMDAGCRQAVLIWHRRAGKDKTLINLMVKKTQERVGVYYYFFPTYKQGRKIIWDGIGKDEFRFMDHFPKELIAHRNDHEMRLQLINGSLFQIIGTDDYDAIRGTNPIGCVFSEYSFQDPGAYKTVSPILAENGGFSVFCYTPKGKNHGYSLKKLAQKSYNRFLDENRDWNDKDWFYQSLTVDDTKVIPEDKLEVEKERLFIETGDNSFYEQEYYVSFEVSQQGAYYGPQIARAWKEKRITRVPWVKEYPVDTWWDLGMSDSTAIWFSQTIGNEIRFIDYYENTGEGLAFYAKVLRDKKYRYGYHTAPWDIRVRELGSGMSRLQIARRNGINFSVNRQLGVQDGIEAVREIFPRCWFDESNCEKGIDALTEYTKEFDEERQEYKPKPVRNWATHGSDSFRTFAVGHNTKRRDPIIEKPKKKIIRKTYSPVTAY